MKYFIYILSCCPNIWMLYLYHSYYKNIGLGINTVDGWIYFMYLLIYDLLCIPILILAYKNIGNFAHVALIICIAQNFVIQSSGGKIPQHGFNCNMVFVIFQLLIGVLWFIREKYQR
jgi:uncharacterized membrane-anchored protein YitT (DUF2179 family)